MTFKKRPELCYHKPCFRLPANHHHMWAEYQHTKFNYTVMDHLVWLSLNLLILSIQDSKAIQLWNHLNPAKQVQVGHAIMAVNGKSYPHLMLEELQSAQTLNLFIKDKLTRVQQRRFDKSLQDQEERLGGYQ